MKSIWSKLLELIKGNKVTTFVIALILILLGIVYFQNQRISHWKDKYQTEVKLKDALIDSVKYYQNARKEWVAEKLTIQETIKNLEKMYGQLSDSQKELIARIKELNKKNEVIAAALITTETKIDSLLIIAGKDGNEVTVDTTKKMINFNNLAAKDTSFVFDIDVNSVLPAHLDIKPTMLFKSIEIPNKQFATFQWKNDKKKGYPISFSISNSNKYVKVVGLESYAIPPLDKLKINPTGWQKVGNFFIKNGRTVLYVGVGAAAGAGAVYLMTK
jgi:hypothetical protein